MTARVDTDDPSEAYLEDGIRFESFAGYLLLVPIGPVTRASAVRTVRSR